MATSTDQYTPVFLPGEPPFPDREAWKTTVYRVIELDMTEATLGA